MHLQDHLHQCFLLKKHCLFASGLLTVALKFLEEQLKHYNQASKIKLPIYSQLRIEQLKLEFF